MSNKLYLQIEYNYCSDNGKSIPISSMVTQLACVLYFLIIYIVRRIMPYKAALGSTIYGELKHTTEGLFEIVRLIYI